METRFIQYMFGFAGGLFFANIIPNKECRLIAGWIILIFATILNIVYK